MGGPCQPPWGYPTGGTPRVCSIGVYGWHSHTLYGARVGYGVEPLLMPCLRPLAFGRDKDTVKHHLQRWFNCWKTGSSGSWKTKTAEV